MTGPSDAARSAVDVVLADLRQQGHPEILFVPEAAAILRMSYLTAWRAIDSGRLKARKRGGRYRLTLRAIAEFLAVGE